MSVVVSAMNWFFAAAMISSLCETWQLQRMRDDIFPLAL
jgi:hypothetical protein